MQLSDKPCTMGERQVMQMLIDSFHRVYSKFTMHFFYVAFKKWKGRELTLTTVETFCMEIIYFLGKPTVSQFARLASLSSANAADKINHLIKKGYLNKTQSEKDKRIFYLEPTQKYLDYYDLNKSYIDDVLHKVEQRFSKEEVEIFCRILDTMDREFLEDYSTI